MTARARVRPVFSLWAWALVTPHFLIQVNGIDPSTRPAQLPAGYAAAIETDLLMGVAFLVAGTVERLLGRWPVARWTFVGLALVACSIVRPLLLILLQALLGVDLTVVPLLVRCIVNLIILGVASLAFHFLIDGFARNLEARDRLRQVETDLELQATLIEAYRDEITQRFRHDTARPVLDALGRLFARELPPRALAEELDWVALTVVPPASLRADGAALEEALEDLTPIPEVAERRGPVRRFLSPTRVEAAPAWAIGVIFVVLLPAGLAISSLPKVLILGAAAILLATGLGWLVARIGLPRRPALAVLALSALYPLLCAGPMLLIVAPVRGGHVFWTYFAYGTISHAAVAVVIAVAMSSSREIRANRAQIAAAVERAERRLAQARRSLSDLGERIAVALREGVFGDLTATSARLKLGEEASLEELYRRVENALESAAEAD